MRPEDMSEQTATIERLAGADSNTLALLQATLSAAVPLCVMQLRRRSPEERQERARQCAQVIASKGDVILYRGKRRGETAAAFAALAEGLACLSFAPGGVRAFGLHFETKEDL